MTDSEKKEVVLAQRGHNGFINCRQTDSSNQGVMKLTADGAQVDIRAQKKWSKHAAWMNSHLTPAGGRGGRGRDNEAQVEDTGGRGREGKQETTLLVINET